MQKSRKHTLISVRRAVTELKTTLAGGIFDIFVGSKASMASFNAEMEPSRPSGRWDLASMVELGGSSEKRVRRERCEAGLDFFHGTPRANGPI